MSTLEYVMSQPRWLLVVQGTILVCLLGLVDFLSGPDVAFSLFYLLPICVIAWGAGRIAGVWMSITSAGVWLVADLAGDERSSSLIVHCWNGTVRLAFFLIIVYLLSAWKQSREDRSKVIKDRMSALADEIAERTRIEGEIRVSSEQYRQLAISVEAAREEERIDVARELHDVLGQALTGLKMDLSWLESRIPQEETEVRSRLGAMKDDAESMLKATKEISAQLRSAVLDHFGLVAALEWQTQEFQRRTGIRSSFCSNVEVVTLKEDGNTRVFRIYAEALTNIARHANATELNAALNREAGVLTLEIADNGRGITEAEISHPASIGLLGMRERARPLGGDIEIHGTPHKGTTLRLTIPMNNVAGNHDSSPHR